ncbi:mediator-associated protein 1 [Quillaja saponaria]|uniref:Mediator-associated protein 1 n=1 Tax=Quillaja saponaria TaxID=32244 RepID=A0AAD7KWF9_QUISA|nr:mediator-associated protein 1 [Quillaja saponaria]
MNAFHEFIKKSLHADVSKGQLMDKIRRLMKKNGGQVEQAKSNGKAGEKQNEGSRTLASLKAVLFSSPDTSKGVRKTDIDQQLGMLSLIEMIRYDKSLGSTGLGKHVIKRGLELIGASKRAELDKMWKYLQVAEMVLFMKRAELIKDQVKLMLERC